MPFADGDLVIGDGPEVYYIHKDKRRWVPDELTLWGLDQRGWAAIRQVAQQELLAVEVGTPVPSLRDGSLLVCTDGTAYLTRGGQLHLVPDAETLASIPRDRATAAEPADIALLQAAVGEPLPSIKDADDEVLAIDNYIRSIAPLPVEPDHDEPGPVVKRPGVTEVDGVPVEVSEQRVRMARQVADFVEISPIPDVMWAGATVTGASGSSTSTASSLWARSGT